MTTDTLLWWNKHHKPLPDAIDEACARFIQRVGLPPTNVILPLGDAPETVGKLRVETSGLVRPWHLQVYSVYQIGDVICMECQVILRNDPRITAGVSHGLCEMCRDVAMAEFEATLDKYEIKQLELI